LLAMLDLKDKSEMDGKRTQCSFLVAFEDEFFKETVIIALNKYALMYILVFPLNFDAQNIFFYITNAIFIVFKPSN